MQSGTSIRDRQRQHASISLIRVDRNVSVCITVQTQTRACKMVTFAKEQVIGVQRLSKKIGVSPDTIRRWFRQGLEKKKVGGTVFTSLEAIDRFSDERTQRGGGGNELTESLNALERMGVNVGREGNKDGNKKCVG